MEPTTDEALVDLVDVLLRDGAVLRADVIVTVADVPLIGISLSAAIAGTETMNEYGMFTEWDGSMRANAIARRQYAEDGRPRHRGIPSRERVAPSGGDKPDVETGDRPKVDTGIEQAATRREGKRNNESGPVRERER